VSDDRFGICVSMMGILINHPVLKEPTKPTLRHPIEETGRHISAKLINRDLQDELRFGITSRKRSRRYAKAAQEKGKSQSCFHEEVSIE
jgi:hypothetical protein